MILHLPKILELNPINFSPIIAVCLPEEQNSVILNSDLDAKPLHSDSLILSTKIFPCVSINSDPIHNLSRLLLKFRNTNLKR